MDKLDTRLKDWDKYMRVAVVGLLIASTFLSGEAIAQSQSKSKSAKIYVWTDESGVLVFSDSPRPGAEEVTIKKNTNVVPSVDTSILDIKPQEIPEEYSISITQPQHNGHVRDNTGSVHVTGRIQPVFKQGFKVQLLLNGKLYDKPQSHSMFALRNIDRGEHELQLQLIDQKGKVIASSEPVTFYMQRAFIKRGQ